MADLTYSVGLLESLSSRLALVAGQMKDDRAMSGLDLEDLAHSRVVDAVHDFRADWDDNRELLARKIDNLATMAGEAARTFTEADQSLADQIADILEGDR